MRFKALKTFSNAYVGNITSGQVFDTENDDLIGHLMGHKLIEPVGDFAYQNKMIRDKVKKKAHPMDSRGSGGGPEKPLSAPPADPASPTGRSNTSENGERPEPAESSSQTPPTGTSDSPTSFTDATGNGGDTPRQERKARRTKTPAKRQTRNSGRRTSKRPKSSG